MLALGCDFAPRGFYVLSANRAALKYVSRHNFGPRPDSLTDREMRADRS